MVRRPARARRRVSRRQKNKGRGAFLVYSAATETGDLDDDRARAHGRYTIHRRSFQRRQESRPSVLRISARRARPRNKTYMARQGPRKRTYRHYGLCHSARPHNRACAYFCTRTAAILAGVGVFGDGRLYHDQGGPPHYKLSRLLLTHGQRRNQCKIAHRRSIAGRE